MAKTKTIENLFNYLAFYSDLLPIFCFLIFFQKLKGNIVTKIIVGYLLFDFIINLALLYFIPNNHHNKAYPIFTLVETLLFSAFFYQVIKNNLTRKKVLYLTIIIAVAFLSYYYYAYFATRQRIVLDSITIGFETILIFIFTFLYFYEQLNDTTQLFIYTKPHFWCVLGILIYLSGSFFIYIFANQITNQELGKFWIITNIVSIIKNLFFTLAFFLQARQAGRNSPPKINLYSTY